ncbi:MAG TPA: hypothetical protein VLE91_03715 [Candidatus Saccharimonadales bacterium]|nr:hypothetical protein [Candidatus Saccharimonadales bacterium]
MFKKIAIISSWFLITPIAFVLLLVLIFQTKKIDYLATVGPQVTSQTYADNKLDGNVLGVQISDMRPFYVDHFLRGTKLQPYSDYMVETADKYSIDYRLIPAIAMKESTGGNAVPEASHNAWGFENGSTQWDSWNVAIDQVGKTLKTRYIDKGMTTPDEIMAVYAPPQLETGGKWAKDVNSFFEKLNSL